MKLIEKLSKEYADSIEKQDFIAAYQAGFNKALYLASCMREDQCEWEEMSCDCGIFSEQIANLGEEEV